MDISANDNAWVEDQAAEELLELAKQHEREGDFKKAQYGYASLIQWQIDRGDPISPHLYERVAAVSAELGDFETAIRMLATARETQRAELADPYGFFRLTLQLVQVCLKSGDVASAAKFLAEAVSPSLLPDGDDAQAAACLQDFRTRSWTGKSRQVIAMGRVDGCLTLARFFAAKGRYRVAIHAAEAAWDALPGAESYFSGPGIGGLIVQLYLDLGDVVGAGFAERRLLEHQNPSDAHGRVATALRIARREVMQGELSSARKRLHDVLKAAEGPATRLQLQAAWALADLLTKLNRVGEACRVVEDVRSRLLDHPLHARWRHDLDSLYKLIQRKRAGADQESLIPLTPDQVFENDPVFDDGGSDQAETPRIQHAASPRMRELFSDTWTFLANRLWAALAAQQPELAAVRLTDLETLTEQTDSPRLHTRTRYYRALYEFYHGNIEVAREKALQCLDDVGKQGTPFHRWEYLDLLARIAERVGTADDGHGYAVAARKQLDDLVLELDGEDHVYFLLNKWSQQDSYLASRIASLHTIQQTTRLPPPLAGWVHRRQVKTERLTRYREMTCLVGWDIQRRLESVPQKATGPAMDPTPDEATSSAQVESWVRTQLSLEKALVSQGTTQPSILDKRWPLFRLPRNVALLHYYVVPDRIFVFVLTSGSIQVHTLQCTKIELYEAVQKALQAIMKEVRVGGGRKRVMQALQRVASDMGIQQILQRIPQSVEHLVFIPHHTLVHVPFAALPCDDDTLLCERFTLSCVPNLRWFQPARAKSKRAKRPRRFLGVAVQDYPGTDFVPLSHAVNEIDTVQRVVDAPAVMLRGSEAQPGVVLDSLEKGGWAHIACHGVLDKDQPHTSRIVVAGPARTTGQVTLAEIQQRQLDKLDLVVLASCWLSGTIVLPGNELICLPAAFLRAGAKGVIAPLWEVDDKMNVDFMKDFYAAARKFSSPWALAEVQRAWLRSQDSKRASPFYWAGYLHHGHG